MSSRSDLAWRPRALRSIDAESTTRLVTPPLVSARWSQKPSRGFVTAHHCGVGREPEAPFCRVNLRRERRKIPRRHRAQPGGLGRPTASCPDLPRRVAEIEREQ